MTGVFGHIKDRLLPLALGALFLLAFTPLVMAADEAVPDETCLMCHDGYNKHLAETTHGLSSEMKKPSVTIACVSCHAGGAVHAEDPSVENVTNPGKADVVKQIEICSPCHQPHTEMNNVGFDPHAGLNLACMNCHSVHKGGTALLIDANADFCGTCHVAVRNEFRRVSNHPLNDGAVTCLSCHGLAKEAEPDYGHGQTARCYSCHPEQSGPYLYEHDAASSFATEGGGCIACHSPHGSPNERLLNQPDAGLCRQCHGIPALHQTQHNGIGQQFDCIDCHSSVHGSYDNHALLDPDLGSKIGSGPGSCWCHKVDN